MNIKKFPATLSALAVCGSLLIGSTANAGQQAALDFRHSTMTIFKWYLKPMAGMVKGKIPFDDALFKENAEGLATAARLNLLAGFPKGSGEFSNEESEAKEAIWEEWSQFAEKFQLLQKESAKLTKIAAGGDRGEMKRQFGATAKTCGGCHKKFRNKK
jgi:cytochrome c556